MRFGEENLYHCEVMLKDLTDSKRIDHRIHQDLRHVRLMRTIMHHRFIFFF
jgi:hypothetical protein